jgi:flagella basal body P-ring formation protein FlgA
MRATTVRFMGFGLSVWLLASGSVLRWDSGQALAGQAVAMSGSTQTGAQDMVAKSARLAQEAARVNRLSAPPQVTQTVTVEQLRFALHAFLEKRYKDKIAEIEVQILVPDEAVTVAAGRLETRIRPRGLHEASGRRMFEVALLIDAKEVLSVKVLADITMQADVLTVTRSIRPEETLEAEDLKLSRITLPPGGHDFVTELDQVVGKRVLKALREESPIRLSALALPQVVGKGDQVTIEVKHGGLLIQANGTTKSGGSIGQSITVLNQDSKKEIRAKVMGPGVVRVEF